MDWIVIDNPFSKLDFGFGLSIRFSISIKIQKSVFFVKKLTFHHSSNSKAKLLKWTFWNHCLITALWVPIRWIVLEFRLDCQSIMKNGFGLTIQKSRIGQYPANRRTKSLIQGPKNSLGYSLAMSGLHPHFTKVNFRRLEIRSRCRKSPISRFSVKTWRKKFYVTNGTIKMNHPKHTIPEFNIARTGKPEPDDRPGDSRLDLRNQRLQKNPDRPWPRRPRGRQSTPLKLTKILFRHFSKIPKP